MTAQCSEKESDFLKLFQSQMFRRRMDSDSNVVYRGAVGSRLGPMHTTVSGGFLEA